MIRSALAVSVSFLIVVSGCVAPDEEMDSPPDLVITHARVLDVRSGEVWEDRSILVEDGRIAAVLEGPVPEAPDTLDAAGRLVAPGLIDVHSHIAYLLGDSLSAGGGLITRLHPAPDSSTAYTEQYIPYGVTTVRDVGSSVSDIAMMLEWSEEPLPWAPRVYPSGGALVTREEGRTPFPGHQEVADSADAVRVLRDYHGAGIRHVKLYWRLERPELEAALAEARCLGMTPTAHIDYRVVPFDTVLALGVDAYEHAYTVAVGAMSEEEFLSAWRDDLPDVIGDRAAGRFYLGVFQYFRTIGRDHPRMHDLVERLAERNAVVTPTLHLFAQRLGLTRFAPPPLGDFDDTSGLTDEQLTGCREGYRIMADYVRRMHEQGVRLAVGTDWVDPGRAVLSEMMLLHDLGLSMPEVFRAATLNGALALGLDDSVGSIEPGFVADLIIFEGDPLLDPEGLLGSRIVVKAGEVLRPERASCRSIDSVWGAVIKGSGDRYQRRYD